MQACVQDLSKESHGMQKLHQCPYPPQGCTSLVTSLLVSLADGPQKKALGVLWECFTSQCRGLAEDTVSEWLRRWSRNPLGSAHRVRIPSVSMYVHVASAHGPKTVSGLEEAVGHQPPAHAHNFSCLAGVVWAKKPWVLQWPRALSAHAPPHKFRTFPCLQPWASEHATESF